MRAALRVNLEYVCTSVYIISSPRIHSLRNLSIHIKTCRSLPSCVFTNQPSRGVRQARKRPKMSLTEETFNPTSLTRSDTFSSSVTAGKTLPPSSLKIPKSAQPRIEYEPLYTDLKLLIGHNWTIYHDALTRFIRAELSANEFGELTDNFVLATPATEHAHNSLICAILFNTSADAPEGGPAAWVSAASDKTTSASTAKQANTSNVGEQRLKAEVMSIPPRDRRRLKAIDKPDEDAPITKIGRAHV